MMDFIESIELKAPARWKKRLENSCEHLVIENGQPIALLVKADSLEEVSPLVEAIRSFRAQAAVQRLREAAQRTGVDRLDSREVEKEIRASRNATR